MILSPAGTASEEFAPLTLLCIVKNCGTLRPPGQPAVPPVLTVRQETDQWELDVPAGRRLTYGSANVRIVLVAITVTYCLPLAW